MGVPAVEHLLDPVTLGSEVCVDLPFNLGPDRLEQPLGRIEFGAVRRHADQRHADARHPVVDVAGRAIPDDGVQHSGLFDPPHHGTELLPFHAVQPAIPDAARAHVHGHKQRPILAPPLDPLTQAHPTAAPAPAHLAEQPHLNLVRPANELPEGEADRRERVRKAPPFQASWAAGSACSCMGRGTFGWQRNRASRLATPPGRYTTPKLAAIHAPISAAVRKRPLATASPTCSCCATLNRGGRPSPPCRWASTPSSPPERYQSIHRSTVRRPAPPASATASTRHPRRSSHSPCSHWRRCACTSARYRALSVSSVSAAAHISTKGFPGTRSPPHGHYAKDAII